MSSCNAILCLGLETREGFSASAHSLLGVPGEAAHSASTVGQMPPESDAHKALGTQRQELLTCLCSWKTEAASEGGAAEQTWGCAN